MTKKDKQIELKDKILKGLDKVYERLIEYKRAKNSELVIIQDGKIIKVKP